MVADLNGSGFIDAQDLLADIRWVDGIDSDSNGFIDDLFGWDFVNNDNNPLDDHGHGTHVAGIVGARGDNNLGVTAFATNRLLESRLGVRVHEQAEAPRYGLEFSVRMVAAQTRVATSLLESPTAGFTLLDVRGFWNISEQAFLVAGVENFTDRTYREHLDFRSPSGRSIFQPGVNFYSGFEIAY